MDLFLDKPLTFEKLGMEAKLSEDPNEWPQQILDNLYRQAPFTSDYSPKVSLDTVDSDRRYALGKVELINRLAINPRDDMTPAKLRGAQKVVLPIIVKDGRLLPMDTLLHNGEVEPLTEDRLRKAMFRPTLFEAIRERPGDLSMIEQLYPPHRQYGGRGPLVSDAGSGVVHTASANSLLQAILPTVKKAHILEFTKELNDDPSLRAHVTQRNPVVFDYITKLAEKEQAPTDSELYLKKVASGIRPTVVQIQKIEGGFRIKTANPQALIPTADDVPRPAAVGALGGDLVSKVEEDGTTTITTQPAIKDTFEDLVIKVIDEFGIYKVKTVGDNTELVGWVFPKVMDFGGEVLPLGVFSNGSQSAVQENIAGVPLARQTDILDSPPDGLGVFYYANPSGATALVPVSVKASVEESGSEYYVGETVLGDVIEIVKLPGLKAPMKVGDTRFAIPADCGFMPLLNPVDLVSSPDEFTKTAEALAIAGNAVRIITDGQVYSFEGRPIDKLAGVMETRFLNKDDAVFLGTILGQEPVKLAYALDKLRKNGQYELWFNSQDIHTFKEKYAAARQKADAFLKSVPDIRTNLLKVAATIEDPTAVDRILSLNFVNAENLAVFASYVPEFETVIKKLSELLLASRLGLYTVDAGAVQRAIVHLDRVVNELKTLNENPQA